MLTGIRRDLRSFAMMRNASLGHFRKWHDVLRLEQVTHTHRRAHAAIGVKRIRDRDRAVSQAPARCVDPVVGAEHRPKLFAVSGAQAKSSAVIGFSLRNPQKEKIQASVLLTLMGNDMQSLETLAASAEKMGSAAIKVGWDILERNVIETAELYGFRRNTDEVSSNLAQASRFLSLNVFKDQDFLAQIYALGGIWEKADSNKEPDVRASELRDFVEACMAVLTMVKLKVHELAGRENTEQS